MALPSRSYNLDNDVDTNADNFEAASCYSEDANRDYEENAPDLHSSTTPPTNTPTPLPPNSAVFGALSQEEIPDSQEDLDLKSNLVSKHESSWSFESDRTVLIPGGTKITLKPHPKYPLHRRGINCNGRLPSEDPRYAPSTSMDDDATQPSTQPFIDPRRLGRNTSGLSNDDESDVICIIHPCSPAAYEAVQLVAVTSPQHILQNDGMSRFLDEVENPSASFTIPTDDHLTEGVPYHNAASRDQNALGQHTKRPDKELTISKDQSNTLDIALRLSSRLHKPYMGFCFGRNPKRCDIVLGVQSDERRVSGMHFRIYLNQQAIVMLQDVSTNGTVVDGNLLRSKGAAHFPHTRMIQQGTVIQLITHDPKEEIKFIVSMPARDHAVDRYQVRLEEYLAYIAQAERQAEAVARAEAEGTAMGLPTVAVHPLNEPVKVPPVSTSTSKPFLGAASSKNSYGMHWNGGDKYNVAGYVGKGAFAMVYKLATIDNGKVFAVKELEKRKFMKNGVLDHKVNNELKIIRKLSHPNIVKYVDHADIPRYLYIIMEYVPGGELLSYISLKGAMPEYMCQSVARQILHALEYLHKCKITHRDIKPDNILIDTTDPLVVKLSDFGLSKVVKDQETFLKTFCGTLLYCAPEVYPDYERYKLGLPRKRRRAHDPAPRTSPYGHAVDIWSFGAVLFHLSSSKPPYMGSADDKGALMLEHIMTTPLDLEPLKQSGVSANGIDCIKKMLVLEPEMRSTERQCLKHPWLATSAIANDEAMEIDNRPLGLKAIHEENEGEDLDASQLSLADDHHEDGAHDGEDSDYFEVDEIDHARRSKRMKFETGYVSRGRPETSSSGEVPYPALPLMRSIESDALNTDTKALPANRLFGEIGASALRSSGVLGQDAHMALEVQMQTQGSRGDTASLSRSGPKVNANANANANANVNDDGVRLTGNELTRHNPKLWHPQSLNTRPDDFAKTASASSLLGAEKLVGQLNMASPEPGASAKSAPNTAPATPGTPRNRDQSPSSITALAGSKRSSNECQENSTGYTSKRSKLDRSIKFDRHPAFYYDTRDPSTWNYAYASKVSGHDYVGEFAARCQAELAESRAKSMSEDKTFDESDEQAIRDKYKENATLSIVAVNEKDPEKRKKFELNRHLWEEDRKEVEAYQRKLFGTREPTLSSKSVAADKEDKFVKPPARLGKLTTLPGSIFETSIKLTERVTTWGRDPDSTVQYKNTKDTRVPKNAFEITFWRSGIEKAIKKGEDWTKMPNVFAIITTRANRYIKVNGVRLTRFADEGDGWLYGRLFSGDVVSVYDYNGEFLKFRCEFFWGASKEARPAGQLFVVEKQTDKFGEAGLESLRRSRERSKTRSREPSAEAKTAGGAEIDKGDGDGEEKGKGKEKEEGPVAAAAAV